MEKLYLILRQHKASQNFLTSIKADLKNLSLHGVNKFKISLPHFQAIQRLSTKKLANWKTLSI